LDPPQRPGEDGGAKRRIKSNAVIERDGDGADFPVGLKVDTDKTAQSVGNQKRGIHTSAVASATDDSDPSFFSEQDINDMEAVEGEWGGDERSPPPHIVGSVKRKKEKFPKHGKAPKARSTLPTPPPAIPSEVLENRQRYIPTLAETPFWRPLLSITVSTRPLAVTLARLSRSLPRGLPFFASISNDDRKTHASYSARMRSMRIDRMESLAVQVAQRLAGAYGGFIGIRFSINDRGRAIGGEGLEAPLPKEQRTIKVAVGNWYRRANEVKEAFRQDAINQVGQVGVGLPDIGETFEIAGLDDFGRRIDDKTGEVIPWRFAEPFKVLEVMKDYNVDIGKLDASTVLAADNDEEAIVRLWRSEPARRREAKLKRQEMARSHKYEIALHLAQKHRSVMPP
jgi:hypothetical protein